MVCFRVLKYGEKNNSTILGEDCGRSTSWKTKTQEKAWLSRVFSFPYLATLLWHGANLQKGFSQNILDARGREREVAGKTAGQWMFHYIWCCFPPKALSKVSPDPKCSSPLWPLGAKQLSTFSFSPSNESLCTDHVCVSTVALFVLTWFPRACLKVFCCLRRGRDTVRKGAIFLGR